MASPNKQQLDAQNAAAHVVIYLAYQEGSGRGGYDMTEAKLTAENCGKLYQVAYDAAFKSLQKYPNDLELARDTAKLEAEETLMEWQSV